MENEIVIKTETIKVSELEGREKQIYEHAWSKGFDAGQLVKEDSRWKAFRIGLTILVFACVTFFMFKNFL